MTFPAPYCQISLRVHSRPPFVACRAVLSAIVARLRDDGGSVAKADPFAVFFAAWQRSDGDLERRISESPRRSLQALAKSLSGINSASTMPMLHYSPGSITPIAFQEANRFFNGVPRARRLALAYKYFTATRFY
jgi:hypothetical protein